MDTKNSLNSLSFFSKREVFFFIRLFIDFIFLNAVRVVFLYVKKLFYRGLLYILGLSVFFFSFLFSFFFFCLVDRYYYACAQKSCTMYISNLCKKKFQWFQVVDSGLEEELEKSYDFTTSKSLQLFALCVIACVKHPELVLALIVEFYKSPPLC